MTRSSTTISLGWRILTNAWNSCATCPTPAIGTAHGFYRGEAKIAYDLLDRITKAVPIPIALHGGTGLTEDQFHRCIALGCGKVNISTMHKSLFIDGFINLRSERPKLAEPLPFIEAQHAAMKADVMQSIQIFGSSGRAQAALAA